MGRHRQSLQHICLQEVVAAAVVSEVEPADAPPSWAGVPACSSARCYSRSSTFGARILLQEGRECGGSHRTAEPATTQAHCSNHRYGHY